MESVADVLTVITLKTEFEIEYKQNYPEFVSKSSNFNNELRKISLSN